MLKYGCLDNDVFETVRSNGYVGEELILLCTKDFNCKKNTDKLNKMISIYSRIGFNVKVLYYEYFTSKRGNGCIEDALKTISQNPNFNGFYQTLKCIGFRGISGEQKLYYINKGKAYIVDKNK